MRLLQLTNLVCHLQLPIARCFASLLGEENFRFVATDPPMEERKKLGWSDEESDSWILRAGEVESQREEFERWWDEADVVIAASRNVKRLADRLRRGKLTFYMSERWWKPPIGIARMLHPRFAWMAYRFVRLSQNSSFHCLPMGGYAGSDMRRIASFPGRMWNWGYFTAVPEQLPPCRERQGTFRVLWAGRMLDWKRVDTLVRGFALLLQKQPDSRLTLIGVGPRREYLSALVKKIGLGDHVDLHPSMPAPQIRQWMRDSDVYVLPSSGYEGWGVVLNEAMAEGCAVVASEGTGSAKAMLQQGQNGFMFSPGDYHRLSELLIQLSRDEPLRRRLAAEGQRTIAQCWSPAAGAERFLAVSEALLANQSAPSYDSGPMMRL